MDFKNIKIVVIDVDGVLSDGYYYVSEEGIYSKSFYTRDFYAIEKALEKGIKIIIITQSDDKIIRRKIDRLVESKSFSWKKYFIDGDLEIIDGSNNKERSIASYLFGTVYSWSHVAYLGDAENDLECMQMAAYTACPADAIESIKENSNYISNYSGGRGFVHDFINFLLNKIEGKENENSGT